MEEKKIIASNKKIYRDYDILDSLEVGIELKGYEAQSARKGHVSLEGAYIKESGGEFYVHNLFIAKNPSVHSSLSEKRKRKILMHKNEIIRLSAKVRERGLAILPLDMHESNNRIKLNIALARRKKLYGNKHKIEERIIKEETRKYRGIK